MAKHIGQIQGNFSTGFDLVDGIRANAGSSLKRVVKVGIQIEKGRKLRLNKDSTLILEVGKTGILEYEDVEIKNMQILRTEEEDALYENKPTLIFIVPAIIDYVYEDE